MNRRSMAGGTRRATSKKTGWTHLGRDLNMLLRGLMCISLLELCCLLTQPHFVGSDSNYCDLDTGYTTIVDGHGYPHSVYISVTRDGSVWMRAGVDQQSTDWSLVRETKKKLHTIVLSSEIIGMMESLQYYDYCVLTDLRVNIQAVKGWHPSYIVAYDPHTKETKIVSIRRKKGCESRTNATFTPDKNCLYCDGGEVNQCGTNNLPERGQRSPAVFIKSATMDPIGHQSFACPPFTNQEENMYTFKGSYYHAFIKLASCRAPKDSRTFGYEAKLRSGSDKMMNTVILPDPLQKALARGTIKGWQVFAKIISADHEVYLQIWRRDAYNPLSYRLVDETFFHPTELRFQEVALDRLQHIQMERNDVLGLFFPKKNPIAYSVVPCSSLDQQYLYLENSPNDIQVGRTYTFKRPKNPYQGCRHYSFSAILANKTNSKLIEDWRCPTLEPLIPVKNKDNEVRASQKKSAENGKSGGSKPNKPSSNLVHRADGPPQDTNGAIPVHIILIIIGCLILMLVLVGFVSYYKAIRS